MDSSQGGKDFSLPDIDAKSGKRIVQHVQDRLKGYLGPDFTDESLAEYVVSQLTEKTSKPVLESSLIDFIGDEDAEDCAAWYVF